MASLLERRVLDLIRSGRAQTQADLCRLAAQNSSTISELLRRLRRQGMVRSAGTRPGGRGRPGTVLRFDPGGYVAAVDIDGAHGLIAILDFGAKVIASKLIGFDGARCSAREVLGRCAETYGELLRAGRISRSRVRGVGIGVNGSVSASGVLRRSSVLPWRDVPMAQLARDEFALPAVVADSSHSALAEYRYGAGRGSRCMVQFSVGDGVSALAVIEGELFAGGGGSAGQIGHFVAIPGGALCGCGQRGCLEALISGPGVCARILRDAAGQKSRPPEALVACARRHATVAMYGELVRQAEEAGDGYCRGLLGEVVELAGVGLAMAIACFSPDLVAIDGYVFRERPALQHRLVDAAGARAGVLMGGGLKIVPSRLGERAKLMTLVALVADQIAQCSAAAR